VRCTPGVGTTMLNSSLAVVMPDVGVFNFPG
jgi:hypothetical protein